MALTKIVSKGLKYAGDKIATYAPSIGAGITAVGTASDIFTPTVGGMSPEEKQYLIEEQKKFSSKNRQENIKNSIQDTKNKTLMMDNDNKPKITLSPNNLAHKAGGMYYDGDIISEVSKDTKGAIFNKTDGKYYIKGGIVDEKGNIFKTADKITDTDLKDLDYISKTGTIPARPGEGNITITATDEVKARMRQAANETGRGADTTQPIKKITVKEATEVINKNVSPNDKAKLDKLKDFLKKSGKTVSAGLLNQIKKHPFIAGLSAAVSTPMIIGYLTEEDQDENEEVVNKTIEETLKSDDKPVAKMYKDREISPTIGGGWVFSGKNGTTRVFDTLEEAQADIDSNLENYYQVEFSKALEAKDGTKMQELIQRARERGIDLEEGIAL